MRQVIPLHIGIPMHSCLAVLMLAGCEYKDQVPPPPAPLPLNHTSGYVVLYDPEGNLMSDCSGVKVSIDGTSYSTLSDKSGRWSIAHSLNKSCKLIFSKEGYNDHKIFGIEMGKSEQKIETVRMPAFPVGIDIYTGSNLITPSGTTITASYRSDRPLTSPPRVIIFFDSTPEVSFMPKFHRCWLSLISQIDLTICNITFAYDSLRVRGFIAGERVYLRAYLASPATQTYLDTEHQGLIITGIKATHNAPSFIMR